MKKLLSVVLAVIMMATFASTVSAEETTYSLWVADVQFTSGNLTVDSTDNPDITSGSAVYDPENGILTLNSFVFSGDTDQAVIYAEEIDLTIKLNGESVINSTGEYSEGIYIDCYYYGGNLKIVDADETNEGADLTIITNEDGEYTDGISATNIEIDDCNIVVNALGIYAYGIGADEDIVIKDSVIEIEAYFCALLSNDSLDITNSEITAESVYNVGIVVDLFAVCDGSATIKDSTVTANGAAEGMGILCDTFEVVNSTVIAEGGTAGIYFDSDIDVITAGHNIYIGDAAPGAPVENPDLEDYYNKYVRIVPENTKSTTVTYEVAPTYTVTIPETVTIGADGTEKTVSAEGVVVEKGQYVSVTLAADNNFTVKTAEGAELAYTVNANGEAVAAGGEILAVNPADGKNGTATITFDIDESAIQYAGTYIGTATFTIAVKDAPVTTINFTIDGVSYQAEEGMTWAQWVESNYNLGDFELDNYGDPIVWFGYKVVCRPDATSAWNDSVDSATVIESGLAYTLLVMPQ